jgi:hypothetical protein
MSNSTLGKPPFSKVHHVGIVVKDIDKAIKRLEEFGIGKFNYPSSLPPFLERLLFRGKTFDTEYRFFGKTYIHPYLFKKIEIGATFDDSWARPLAEDILFRGKPFRAEYKIYKTKVGDKYIELFEPVKGASPFQEYMDKSGEGIQHVAFESDNMEKDIAWLLERGATAMMTNRLKGGGGGDYLELGAGGFVVEIFKYYF